MILMFCIDKKAEMIRVSVGIETVEDLIADIEQSLSKI